MGTSVPAAPHTAPKSTYSGKASLRGVRIVGSNWRTRAVSSSASPQLDNLSAWLSKNGCLDSMNSAVGLSEKEGQICITAARELRAGETVVEIPKKAWITTAEVATSVIGAHVQEQEPWLQLVLFVIAQAAGMDCKDCPPYACTLPDTSCNSTLFWTDEELSMLEGSQCLANTIGYRDFLERRFTELSETLLEAEPEVFPREVFTFERFMWAFGWVRSRAHAPLEKDDIALVPVADLAVHNSSSKAEWKVKESGMFGRSGRTVALQADRTYAAGEMIEMNFRPNGLASQLALDYGVGDPNLAGFSLTLAIPEDDRFFDDKADIAEIGGYAESWTWTLRPDEEVPGELLAYLRLINCQGEDAFHLEALFRDVAWQHHLYPISEANETAVCQSIVAGCTDALNGYSSTIDEDLALLREGNLSTRQRIAVEVRLGEKQTLDNYLTFFATRAERVQNLEYYAESRLKSLGLLDDRGNNTFEDYLDSGIA